MATVFGLIFAAVVAISSAGHQITQIYGEGDVGSEVPETKAGRLIIEDKIKKWLEEFRNNMTRPNIDLDLPKMDPLTIDRFPLDVRFNCLQNSGFLENVEVEGLSTFVVDRIHIKILGLHLPFRLYVEQISVSGTYNYSLNISEHLSPVAGNALTIQATDVVIGGDLQLAVNDTASKNLYLKSLSLEIFYGTLSADVEKAGDEVSAALGVLLSKILATSLADGWQDVVRQARDSLATLAGHLLHGATLADLIG